MHLHLENGVLTATFSAEELTLPEGEYVLVPGSLQTPLAALCRSYLLGNHNATPALIDAAYESFFREAFVDLEAEVERVADQVRVAWRTPGATPIQPILDKMIALGYGKAVETLRGRLYPDSPANGAWDAVAGAGVLDNRTR